MDWITEDVAIGNYLEAQDADLLSRERIGSVLGLTRTLEGTTASGLKIKEIVIGPLEDALGNDLRLFEKALDALTRLAADAGPVLVHCHAGRSRSVVVVAGYLMRSLGLGADEALAHVASKRDVAVTEGLERLLDTIA